MKNNNTIIVVIVALMLLLGGVLFFYMNNEVDWSQNYRYDSKEPYGTHIVKTLLEKNSANSEFTFIKDSTYRDLKENKNGGDNYVFIGEALQTSMRDIDSIVNFVADGNNAYIIANRIDARLLASMLMKLAKESPESHSEALKNLGIIEEQTAAIEDTLILEDPYDIYDGEPETYDEEATTPAYEDYEEEPYDSLYYLTQLQYLESFTSETIVSKFICKNEEDTSVFQSYWNGELICLDKTKYTHELIIDFEPVYWEWWAFNTTLFEFIPKDKIEILGVVRSDASNPEFVYPNFIKVSFGKGTFYLHLNPVAFSNYHLLDEKKMNYARSVFDELGTGKIYWSEDNRYFDYTEINDSNSPSVAEEGPMEFILSEPSLRKGWYLLLAGVLLYLLFGAKRKQRPIPIAVKKENTSIEYAEVIAQLFLSQTDHKQLIQLKSDQFKFYLRDRFNIHLPKNITWDDDAAIRSIAVKTNTNVELIKSIIKAEGYFKNLDKVDTPAMLSFHHKLEEFYKSSK